MLLGCLSLLFWSVFLSEQKLSSINTGTADEIYIIGMTSHIDIEESLSEAQKDKGILFVKVGIPL